MGLSDDERTRNLLGGSSGIVRGFVSFNRTALLFSRSGAGAVSQVLLGNAVSLTHTIFGVPQLGLVDVEVLDQLRFLNGVATCFNFLKFLDFHILRGMFKKLLLRSF